MLWSVKNVSAYLNISESMVYKLVSKNELSCIRLGDCIRFRPETIENIAKENDNSPAPMISEMNYNAHFLL